MHKGYSSPQPHLPEVPALALPILEDLGLNISAQTWAAVIVDETRCESTQIFFSVSLWQMSNLRQHVRLSIIHVLLYVRSI